jgi:hypothetical protein
MLGGAARPRWTRLVFLGLLTFVTLSVAGCFSSPSSSSDNGGYSGSAFAYDPVHRTLVIYGGSFAFDRPPDQQHQETWTWDGRKWQQQHPKDSPPARLRTAMAFDPVTQRVILYGGLATLHPFSAWNDTWMWDGANWTQLHPPSSPSSVLEPALAYDGKRGELILAFQTCPDFLPCTPDEQFGKTYAWTGTTWVTVSNGAPYHYPRTIANDPQTGRVVGFAGDEYHSGCSLTGNCHPTAGYADLEIWESSGYGLAGGVPAWREASQSDAALQHPGPTVTDPARGSVLVLTDDATTWGLSGDLLVRENPQSAPPLALVKDGFLFADGPGRRVVLVGPPISSYPEYSYAWSWNGSDWSQLP